MNKPLHFSSVSVGIMAGNRRQSPMGFWGKLNTRTIYGGMNNKKMASSQGLAISGSHFWPLAWKDQGSKSHQSLVRARGSGEEPPDRGYTQRTKAHCQTAWWSRGSEVGSRHALTSLPACVPGALQEARGQRSLSAAVHSGQLPEAQSRTTRQRIMGEGKR